MLAVLTAAALSLAAIGGLGWTAGILVALVGVALSATVRLVAGGRMRAVAPVPVLVALGVLTATVPLGPIPEILAGAAGVAFLAWLADDPARPAGGVLRGALGWGLPGLAVGLAWVSSFLLPPTAAPVGVAGALLAATIVALTLLFRRPELASAAPAPTL
jgi:hypothetical protein